MLDVRCLPAFGGARGDQGSMFIFFSPSGAKNSSALICEALKFLCPAAGDSSPAIFALISVQVVSRYEIADPLN